MSLPIHCPSFLSSRYNLPLILTLVFLFTSPCLTHPKTIGNSSPGSLVNKLLTEGDVSLDDCNLTDECDGNIQLSENLNLDHYGQTTDGKAIWSSLGLRESNLHVNNIAVGFVPAFNEKTSPNTPEQINAKLPKPMSIVSRSPFVFVFQSSPFLDHMITLSFFNKKKTSLHPLTSDFFFLD